MVNSIIDNMDLSALLSEIHLAIGYPHSICVVVEGVEDCKLFFPLFKSSVYLVNARNGKNKVEDIITHFMGEKKVIGIRDRDYQTSPISNQIFYCDYCCAEMMVISQNSCFERAYSSFYKEKIMNPEELRLYCLKHLEFLSKFRMCNEKHDWHIRFDGIRVGCCYCDDINIMNQNLKAEMIRVNEDNPISEEFTEIIQQQRNCDSLEDYLTITNGHDFTKLFREVCYLNGNHNLSIENVEDTIRATFGVYEFQNTSLYQKLSEYQTNNDLNIV